MVSQRTYHSNRDQNELMWDEVRCALQKKAHGVDGQISYSPQGVHTGERTVFRYFSIRIFTDVPERFTTGKAEIALEKPEYS